MRTLSIHATRGGSAQTLTTSATTLGEITGQLQGMGIDTDNVQIINRDTRSVLASSASVLPEGDGTLFIIPKKTKSGHYVNVSDLYDSLASAVATKQELQSEIASTDLQIIEIQKQISQADSYSSAPQQQLQSRPTYQAPVKTQEQLEYESLLGQGGFDL